MPKEPIILASASPRRRELLARMGIPFEVVTADVREIDTLSPWYPLPTFLARVNAYAKAMAVAESEKGARRWVLGADTVVALNGRLFGKPESLDQAREFLRALSGRTHHVITGCALIDEDRKEQIFHKTSRVVFKALTDEVIERYLAEVHVLDKAGAYALQEHGDWIIKGVRGSRNNVIGLPTEILKRYFQAAGLL